jgi:hypothetical protein
LYIHTHGRDEDLALIFSPERIETARHFSSVDAYLATPNRERVIFEPGGKDDFPRERL